MDVLGQSTANVITSSNRRGYPPIPLSVSSRGCRLTYIALNVTYSYCRFIYCNKQGQTPLRMRIDHIFFADAGTHISDHTRAAQVHMYITLHLRQKQGQNAIAHAYWRIGRWWDTYIIPQACQDSPHVYYATSTAKNKDKTPLRMRIDGFADGGTHISYHKPAKTVHMYITLDLRQKQGQNAIAHAYWRICRWWDTYIIPQACQDSPHVYYASSTAKTRTKRHCACVLTDW